MVYSLASFVACCRDPNKPMPVSVQWPQFTADSQHYIQLAEQIVERDTFDRSHQLDFWIDVVPAIEGPVTCGPRKYYVEVSN